MALQWHRKEARCSVMRRHCQQYTSFYEDFNKKEDLYFNGQSILDHFGGYRDDMDNLHDEVNDVAKLAAKLKTT